MPVVSAPLHSSYQMDTYKKPCVHIQGAIERAMKDGSTGEECGALAPWLDALRVDDHPQRLLFLWYMPHTLQLPRAVYEGYGPGGVALIVECLTDKKTRTVQVLPA
jgi:transcriptional regulator